MLDIAWPGILFLLQKSEYYKVSCTMVAQSNAVTCFIQIFSDTEHILQYHSNFRYQAYFTISLICSDTKQILQYYEYLRYY